MSNHSNANHRTRPRRTNFIVIILIIPSQGHDHKHRHAAPEAIAAAPTLTDSPAPAARPVEFDEGFAAVKKYFIENGHSKVPQATMGTRADGTEFQLGKWVQTQRQKFKNTYT